METRTKKAFLNVGSNFILQILKSVFTFITRTVFIYCLGKEALGLNGLFTNILSMLSLAELGISTAINFSLYEPIAKGNLEKVSALMTFYKKAYKVVGMVVFFIGLTLIPFLHFLIKDIETIDNVYFIYFLYLISTASSYFISYKETLINADQKNYKLTFLNILFLMILNIAQIVGLLVFKQFIAYLIIQLTVQIVQKIVINKYISTQYKTVNFKSTIEIAKEDKLTIKNNVKAMFFHKIGDYCVNGTDNLIISSFINIGSVGVFSNYATIITLIQSFTNLFFNNLISTLGNLLLLENNEKKYEIYHKLDFIGFIMYGFSAIVLLNVFNDFISLWIGEEYCLEYMTVYAIVISFYLNGIRVAATTMKSAAGMYDVDKYTPLLQAVINLIVSVFLVKYLGVLGVVLGTIISSLVLPTWQRPYIVYKYVLKKDFRIHIAEHFKYIFVLLICALLSLLFNSLLSIESNVLLLVLKVIVCGVIYLSTIVLVYGKTEEFSYILNMILKILKRRQSYE